MVEEIGEEHSVIRAAKLNFEGAARQFGITVGHTGLASISLRDFKHRRPVHGNHMRLRILFGHLDAEQAVARRDIKHAHWSVATFEND